MKQDGQAVDVVIMAAGKGSRMKSRLPKVLHRLAGRALLQHVLDTAVGLQARRVQDERRLSSVRPPGIVATGAGRPWSISGGRGEVI